MTQVDLFIVLLITYQVKHFLADYPLQTSWMLRKENPGWGFLIPLSFHAGVHAALTLTIALVVRPSLWWLALIDFVVHAVMDRLKASRSYLGRFRDPRTHAYWNALGLDQMVHHLTHIWLAWLLVFKA